MPRIPATGTLMAAVLLAMALAGCHPDRTTGPAVADVSGTWWARFSVSDSTADSVNVALVSNAVGDIAGTGTLSGLDSTGAVTGSERVAVIGRVNGTRIGLVFEIEPEPADTVIITTPIHEFDGAIATDSLSGTYTILGFHIPLPGVPEQPTITVPAVFHRVP